MEFGKKDPKVNVIIKNTYPSYKGRRKITVESRKSYCVSNYWDGGSRTYVLFYDLDKNIVISQKEAGLKQQIINNPFKLNMGKVELRPGIAAIENSIFCGKNMGIRIVVCEEDLKKF